ncbi:YlbG family protein [Bacillus salitolerans]|uniref:UPF0298 protein ACFSCX_03870 n=1 Tax=Bacillus salitolerans TaxID=1437434 RepID=A0ABW4LKG0_9BACI
MLEKRQGIIIWLQHLKNIKNLRRFGNIHYVSKRLKYCVLYCDMNDTEQIMKKIQVLPFVKSAEPSYKPFIKTEYENSRPDKAKEYDYKIGI